MSAADIGARRVEAVRALEASDQRWAAQLVRVDPLTVRDIAEAIIDIDASDLDALHALALLLAAMTEPT